MAATRPILSWNGRIYDAPLLVSPAAKILDDLAALQSRDCSSSGCSEGFLFTPSRARGTLDGREFSRDSGACDAGAFKPISTHTGSTESNRKHACTYLTEAEKSTQLFPRSLIRVGFVSSR